MTCSEILQLLGIIASVFIGIVAIFGEKIRGFIFKPKLSVGIENIFPYYSLSQFESGSKFHIYRMIIKNEGNADAKNVQVYLNKVEQKGADGKFATHTNILPINLNWSYQESGNTSVIADLLSPKMEKYCDFFYIKENTNFCILNTEYQFSTNGMTNNALTKGMYRVHLIISCSDAMPVKRVIEFEYSGTWSNDINEMIKSIKIKEDNK